MHNALGPGPLLSSFDLMMTPPSEQEPKLTYPATSTASTAGEPYLQPSPQSRPLFNLPQNAQFYSYSQPSYPRNSFCAYNGSFVIAPRPYEDIYVERAYLSSMIQNCSTRVADYIHDYSNFESKLRQGAYGKSRRRLRKTLGLLRTRISEASQQQRAAFSRLGEVILELQSRDAWNTAFIQGAGWRGMSTPHVNMPWSASAASNYNTMSLSAECPAFEPEAEPYASVEPEAPTCSTSLLNPECPVFVPKSKQHGHHERPSERQWPTSLETVPELVEEEEREEMESLSEETAREDSFSEHELEPTEQETQASAVGKPICDAADPEALQKEANTDGWHYVQLLSEESDLEENGHYTKRWSLPVMRFTWPTE